MEKKDRLFSLDALRGLDMLFLCVVQPILWTAAQRWHLSAEEHSWVFQLDHHWGGFTCYDIIMPLFIFMCGAAIPFALPRRLDAEGRPTAAFWKHVAWRFVMLWVLGMVAQGRLLQFDPTVISPFNNTLQTIAIGYVIAALVLLIRRRWIQIVIPFALAAVYGVALHLYGDYSPDGNLAIRFEEWFVRLIMPASNRAVELADPYYTWWFTIPMFGVMTLCGMNATLILKSDRTPWRKAGVLALLGAALWAGGFGLELLGVPCIKHIYSVSFTAEAMGVCVLLLTALYILNDIWRFRRGWWLVTLYGQTALCCYVVGEIFRVLPATASKQFIGGLTRQFGVQWEGVLNQVGTCIALTFFLWLWRSHKSHRA